MTRSSQRRRSQRGIVLFELLMSTFLIAAVLAGIVAALVMVSRVFALETNNSMFTSRGRTALDMMRQDAIGSSQVLPTITYGSTAYTTSTSGTIILQTPMVTYNSDGSVGTTYQDVVIYHLVGSAAPYTLNRIVIPATGSPTPAEGDTVIAYHVQSLALTYLHSVSWTGDGTTTTFPLDVPPANVSLSLTATLTEAGTLLDNTSSISAWVSASLCFPNGALSLLFPPPKGKCIETSYPVDPTTTAGDGGISTVSFDLTMSAPVTVQGASSSQSLELISVAKLRNH